MARPIAFEALEAQFRLDVSQFKRSLAQVRSGFRNIGKQAGTASREVRRGTRRASRAIRRLGRAAFRTAGAIGAIGKRALLSTPGLIGLGAGAAGLTFGFVKMITAAAELEQKLVFVDQIAKFTKEDFIDFRFEVLNLSERFGRSSVDIAVAARDVVSNLTVSKDEVLDFLEVATQAAVAGQSDVISTSRILRIALTGFSKENLTARKASDILFTAIETGSLEFEFLQNGIGRVAAEVETTGLKFNEFAAISTFLLKRLPKEEAFTAIAAGLRGITGATPEATKAFRIIGVELSAANLEARGVFGTLEDIKAAIDRAVKDAPTLKKLRDAFPELPIRDVRAQDLLRILFREETARKALTLLLADLNTGVADTVEAFRDTVGATERASSRISETLIERFNRFKASIFRVAIEFGTVFGEALKPEIEALIPKVQAFGKGLATAVKQVLRTGELEDESRGFFRKIRKFFSQQLVAGFSDAFKGAVKTPGFRSFLKDLSKVPLFGKPIKEAFPAIERELEREAVLRKRLRLSEAITIELDAETERLKEDQTIEQKRIRQARIKALLDERSAAFKTEQLDSVFGILNVEEAQNDAAIARLRTRQRETEDSRERATLLKEIALSRELEALAAGFTLTEAKRLGQEEVKIIKLRRRAREERGDERLKVLAQARALEAKIPFAEARRQILPEFQRVLRPRGLPPIFRPFQTPLAVPPMPGPVAPEAFPGAATPGTIILNQTMRFRPGQTTRTVLKVGESNTQIQTPGLSSAESAGALGGPGGVVAF